MLTKEQCREIAFEAQFDWAVNAPGTLRLEHAIADALHAAMVEERESNLRRVVAELRFVDKQPVIEPRELALEKQLADAQQDARDATPSGEVMSKQPSERAFDVASTWQGHKFDCAIHRDPGRDDADCTCIVRDLARAIDAALAAAREEAYEKAARLIETQYRRELDSLHEEDSQHEARAIIGRVRVRDSAAIRALAAQEARDGK